ncbi:MAG: hypothetical protein ACXWD8_19055 [Mycobacterium sp.]
MRSGVVSAADVYDLAGFEVIVVGALYAKQMAPRRSAIRVKRNAAALRKLPVWLVSSGPLDESAEQSDIPATPQVRKLAAAVGARGHVTFGGRLAPDAMGFPASAMAKTNAGDWRDPEHVRGCLNGQTPYE